MSGMAQQMVAPNGQKAVLDRLNILDMSRNILNTVAIDANDEYTVTSHSFSGVPDVLDRFATALSAVTGMPKTLLFGEQSKGLGGANEGDLQNWYAQVHQWQKTKLKQPLDRLVTMLAKSLGLPDQNYIIEFEPLHVPSEKEKAETEKLEAEAEKIEAETALAYVTAGALDPSELRATLIEDGDYIMDGSIQIQNSEDDGGEA
jgi:phage-related protein (TIGR01555 family)